MAGDKVGVRGMRQPEGAGGVEHDLVDFRELVFGDTDTVDALPGVQLSAGEEHEGRDEEHQQRLGAVFGDGPVKSADDRECGDSHTDPQQTVLLWMA